ncbi:MAG: methyl-accepting chemotaxis protein [Pseudomonadales bacterium]
MAYFTHLSAVFSQLAIAKKIAVIPAILLSLSAIGAVVVSLSADKLKVSIDQITEDSIPVSKLASSLIANTYATQVAVKQYYYSHSANDLALIELKLEQHSWLLAELELQLLSQEQRVILGELLDYTPGYAALLNRELSKVVRDKDALVSHFNNVQGPHLGNLLTNVKNASYTDPAVAREAGVVQLHLSQLLYYFNIYAAGGRSADYMRSELELMALKERVIDLLDAVRVYSDERIVNWLAEFSEQLNSADEQLQQLKVASDNNRVFMSQTIPQARFEMENYVLRLQVSANSVSAQVSANAHANIAQMTWRNSLISVAALVLGILLSLWVIRKITSPIESLSNKILEIADSGELSARVVDLPQDEIGRAGVAFNKMLAQQQQVIGEVSRVVGQLSVGNFDSRMEKQAKGDFLVLKTALNRSCGNIETSMAVISQTMLALRDGNFDQLPESEGLEGNFEQSVVRARDTMRALGAAISDISAVMHGACHGDFSLRVSADVSGDLQGLKQSINTSMSSLEDTVSEIMGVANAMSEGVLSQQIDGRYQGQLALITEGLNATLDNLKATVGDVQQMADKVKHGAKHISDEGQKLDTKIATQMDAVTEIVASMKQVLVAAELNAQSSGTVNQVMQNSLRESEESREVLDLAMHSMSQIKASSSRISEIIEVINAISFQTNILALNAAVEAARAGDHGRGFSVVAHEIRALSQRTSEAAKDIEVLIKDSSVKVIEGNDLVLQTGEALQRIYSTLQQTGVMVADITVASNQQIDSVQDVNSAIEQLEVLSEQNKHLVQSAAAASTSLDDQAATLSGLMAHFELEQDSPHPGEEPPQSALATG